MNMMRETRNARAAIRGFNTSRGKRYEGGDEADVRDLLVALMALCAQREGSRTFYLELHSAEANYKAETH